MSHRDPTAIALALTAILLCAWMTGASGRSWTLSNDGTHDFTSFRRACDSAAAGDSILVFPGDYDEGDSVIDLVHKPLSILGQGSDPDQTRMTFHMYVVACDGTEFKNISIRRSWLPIQFAEGTAHMANCTIRDNYYGDYYGSIESRGTTLLVEDCAFSGNQARGPNACGGALWGAPLQVRRCEFVDNQAGLYGGAVYACDGTPGSFVEDCVFFRNTAASGAGIAMSGYVEVSNCTLLNNTVTSPWGGAFLLIPEVSVYVSVNTCIMAGTKGGYGVDCTDAYTEFHCCDIWGNEKGSYSGGCFIDCSPYFGDISEDPLFCDAVGGDVGLMEGSPCLPGVQCGGSPCGLIGARGVGCGKTPVRPMSWGRVKAIFR